MYACGAAKESSKSHSSAAMSFTTLTRHLAHRRAGVHSFTMNHQTLCRRSSVHVILTVRRGHVRVGDVRHELRHVARRGRHAGHHRLHGIL